VALLDRPLDDLSGVPGSARILVDRPGRIDVETSAPGKQLLVLTERFHPGWRATADGRELQTLSVYDTYLGCVVNPGTSRIQFVFAPRSLTVGIAVTLGGWLKPPSPGSSGGSDLTWPHLHRRTRLALFMRLRVAPPTTHGSRSAGRSLFVWKAGPFRLQSSVTARPLDMFVMPVGTERGQRRSRPINRRH
jgi:hypothetical protein